MARSRVISGKAGSSREVLTGLADIGRSHLRAIERGERKPTLASFFRLCSAPEGKPSEVMAAIEAEIGKKP